MYMLIRNIEVLGKTLDRLYSRTFMCYSACAALTRPTPTLLLSFASSNTYSSFLLRLKVNTFSVPLGLASQVKPKQNNPPPCVLLFCAGAPNIPILGRLQTVYLWMLLLGFCDFATGRRDVFSGVREDRCPKFQWMA